jgi:lysophospholipase L1-like esterase
MPRILPRLLALALSTLFALAAVELGLRARGPAPEFRIWPPGLEVELEPRAEVMPGVSGTARFRVSTLGFRADERPDDVELSILALGGSATECLYLDQDEAWPARLQLELGALLARRVWVANAGKSGRTTRDHVLQLRHLLAQEPRFQRVLLLTGVNDLCAWLAGGVPATRPAADLGRAFDVVPPDPARSRGWKPTAVWELLCALRSRLAGSPLGQDRAGEVYATWRAHRREARSWLADLPDPAPALAEFRAVLLELLASATRHGVGLVLVTQPALWSAELAPELEARLWLGGVGDFQHRAGCDYYATPALARGLALFNAALEDFAHAHGLPLLDLARGLGGDPRCFYDDVHFSEEGARRAASFLAHGLGALEVR